MIRLVDKTELPHGYAIAELPPDRPAQGRDIRKLLFFLVREGFYQAVIKVLARLDKQRTKDSKVLSARCGAFNAVSYDGGVTFYLSDKATDCWQNPFSYDCLPPTVNPHDRSDFTPAKNALYCIGYGNYVQTYTRHLKKRLTPRMFVDYNPEIVNGFSKTFQMSGYDFSVLASAWAKDKEPVAVIASYHSDHARQAHTLFKGNPEGFIFVEKPPLVDYQDIQLYRELYAASALIQIGFNRRYAPLVKKLKSALVTDQPMIISISVNEVRITDSHWYHWPNQGTRITGNACHWIDLCQYLTEDLPIKIQLARSTLSPDDCALVITYQHGSLAVITLTDKGNDLRGVQESIEVKQANVTMLLDDMLWLTVDEPHSGRKIKRSLIRDKGHKWMYQQFARDIERGAITGQYPLADLEIVSRVTYEFSEMLKHHISEKSLVWGSQQ